MRRKQVRVVDQRSTVDVKSPLNVLTRIGQKAAGAPGTWRASGSGGGQGISLRGSMPVVAMPPSAPGQAGSAAAALRSAAAGGCHWQAAATLAAGSPKPEPGLAAAQARRRRQGPGNPEPAVAADPATGTGPGLGGVSRPRRKEPQAARRPCRPRRAQAGLRLEPRTELAREVVTKLGRCGPGTLAAPAAVGDSSTRPMPTIRPRESTGSSRSPSGGRALTTRCKQTQWCRRQWRVELKSRAAGLKRCVLHSASWSRVCGAKYGRPSASTCVRARMRAVLCCVVLCCAVLCCAVRVCARACVLCCVVLCCLWPCVCARACAARMCVRALCVGCLSAVCARAHARPCVRAHVCRSSSGVRVCAACACARRRVHARVRAHVRSRACACGAPARCRWSRS